MFKKNAYFLLLASITLLLPAGADAMAPQRIRAIANQAQIIIDKAETVNQASAAQSLINQIRNFAGPRAKELSERLAAKVQQLQQSDIAVRKVHAETQQERIAAQEALREELQEELGELTNEKTQLEATLREATDLTEEQKTNYEAQIAALNARIAKLEAPRGALGVVLGHGNVRIEQLQKEKADLEQQLKNVIASNTKLEQNIRVVQDELDNEKAARDVLQDQRNQLQKRLAEGAPADVAEALKDAQETIKRLEESLNRAEAQLAEAPFLAAPGAVISPEEQKKLDEDKRKLYDYDFLKKEVANLREINDKQRIAITKQAEDQDAVIARLQKLLDEARAGAAPAALSPEDKQKLEEYDTLVEEYNNMAKQQEELTQQLINLTQENAQLKEGASD